MKSGDSENDQPNDNGPNACMKGIYNETKELWSEKFGTTSFTPGFMNQVIVCTWGLYKLKAAPIIVNAFKKTRIYPLQPPSKDPNLAGGALTASMQVSTEKSS